MNNFLQFLIFGVGCVLFFGGVHAIYPPAALILGGIACVLFAFLLDDDKKGKK